MKFSKYMEDNPSFWSDNFPTLPSSVTDIINEYFYYRDICNDTRFTRYFKSKINLKLDEFLSLYNKEIEFRGLDPFILQDIERTVDTVKKSSIEDILNSIRKFSSEKINTKDLTNLETRNLENSLSDNNLQTIDKIETKNLTDTVDKTGTETNVNSSTFSNTDKKTGEDTLNTKNTGTNTTKNTGTTNTSSNTTNDGTNKFSDYPQSDITLTDYLSNQNTISNSSNVASLTTDNTQNETTLDTNVNTVNNYNTTIKTDSTNSENNTLTKDLTDTSTQTGTVKDSGTVDDKRNVSGTDTGTVTGTVTGTDKNNYTSNSDFDRTDNISTDENVNLILKELRKGNFVDLYRKYYNIVAGLNSVDWLVEQLDPCFIQIFDEEEEYSTSDTSDLEEKIAILQQEISSLDTRVDALEAGGGGGGVSKEYVDQKVATVQGEVDTINTTLVEVNNSLTELGTDIIEINPVINGLTPRAYNFNNSEPSGAGIGNIQVGTLLIYGDSVSNIQLYVRVSPIINTTGVAALTGGFKVKVNNTSDYNLIKEYFTTVFNTFPPRNPIIENIPGRFFNTETYEMEYYSRKHVTLGEVFALMCEGDGPELDADDLWIGLNGSLDLDPTQQNYIPDLPEFGYAGYLFKLI